MQFFGQKQSHATRALQPGLGLDIGESALRWMQLSPGPRPKIESLGLTPLPGDAGHDDPLNHPRLTDALRSGWRMLNTRTLRVAIALPSDFVRYRALSLPCLPEHQLHALLCAEAAQLHSLPEAEISMDYQPLPAHPDTEEPDGVTLLIGAAPLAEVLRRVRAVQLAGLKVARLDVDSFALLAACAHLEPWQGARYGRRIMLHAGHQHATCHLLPPGAWFPDQPARQFRLDAELTELTRALAAMTPEAVVLSGESGQVHKLEQALAPVLRAPATRANPFTQIDIGDEARTQIAEHEGCEWALAYGLALSALQ